MKLAPENYARPLLQAVGIHKRFGRRSILRNLDLDVHEREIITVIGPNGSGKTTLLRMLLGMMRSDEGEILRMPELRIGYVPQSIHFDQSMPLTVLNLLRLISTDRRHINEVAEELEITPYLNRQVHALSGGELQRVLLTQALLNEPHLLVLDEPVQGVDFSNQAALYKLIRNIARERGCAVLMVSHDLHLVMAGTDRVICLNGHICCSGTPQHVSRDPEFINLFGADVANQIAYYVHHHDHRHDEHGDVVAVQEL